MGTWTCATPTRDEEERDWAQRFVTGRSSWLEVVERYFAAYGDRREAGLAYLAALERIAQRQGDEEMLRALAVWRLRGQMLEQEPP
jgi:hypothetical protein